MQLYARVKALERLAESKRRHLCSPIAGGLAYRASVMKFYRRLKTIGRKAASEISQLQFSLQNYISIV